MPEPLQHLQIQVSGAKEDLDLLRQSLATDPKYADVRKYAKQDDGSTLSFGVAELMVLLAVLKGAAAVAAFCKTVHELMQTARQKRIVIQTTTGRVEIRSSANLTLTEVEDLLRKAVEGR